MGVYCRSSLFSPNPSQYYVDGVPKDAVEGYPGQRKRHKITQLASYTKTWSEKPHATAFCHYITPSECSRIFSGTNFAKTAKLPLSLQFSFIYCFLTFFRLRNKTRLSLTQPSSSKNSVFYNKWWTVLFLFFFFFFFFSCNHHHIRVTGKWKADLNDLEWFVRNQQTIIWSEPAEPLINR